MAKKKEAAPSEIKPIAAVGIQLRIKDVTLVGFSTTENAEKLEGQLLPTEYEFQFELNMNFQQESKVAEFAFKATVFNNNDKPKLELGNIKSVVSFIVANFNEVIPIQDGKMVIPNQLIYTGASVAISTTRGMFALCAATSKLSNAIIPLIDPQKFVTDGVLVPHQ